MNWKRASIAAVFALPVVGLLGWGLSRDPKEIISPLPGREASPFNLRVFAPGEAPLSRPVGDTVRLTAMKGDVVVLNFWASWCLECRVEHQTLSEVARAYAGKPVHFVGVLYNDEPDAGTEWIGNMGGQSYPSAHDPKTRTAIDYGVYGVPETFFVDANGRVAFKNTGPISETVLRRVVDSLIAAAPPRVAPVLGKLVP